MEVKTKKEKIDKKTLIKDKKKKIKDNNNIILK